MDDPRWVIYEGRWEDAPLGDHKIDHIISDPPFTDHVSLKQRGNKGKSVVDAELSFMGIRPEELAPKLVPLAKRWAILFCAIEQVGAYQAAMPSWYVRGGVWVKDAPTPQITGDRPAQWGEALAILHAPGAKRWNGGGLPARWTGLTVRGDERYHETCKPVWLMTKLIEQFTDPDDLILDPFCGSGTTGVAAMLTGRRFVGCELQPHYAAIARERLEAAASQGITLNQAKAKQASLFG